MHYIDTAPKDVGLMPNQVFGTLNGDAFYFRARSGSWTLQKGGADGPELAEGIDDNAGWWTGEEAIAFCETILQLLDNDVKEHGT